MHVHTIKKDQSLHSLLSAGSTLFVKAGSIRIVAAPQFLEGVAWQTDTVLHEGMCHEIECGGWMRLHALQTCEVVVQQTRQAHWRHLLMRCWHGAARFFNKKRRPGLMR